MGITRSVKKIGSGTIRQNYYMKATTPKILYKYDENSKKLYLCETQDYSFQILDLKGNILRVVHRDHENKKLQQSDREEIIEDVLVKQPPEFKRLVLETLPPQFCAILDIQLLPKDFVVVYRITGFSTYEMDLFGPDGIFLRTLRVPLKTIPSGMFFYKENLVMVETVDEVDTYREYRIKNYADIFSH